MIENRDRKQRERGGERERERESITANDCLLQELESATCNGSLRF